jgi:hypothetical protein
MKIDGIKIPDMQVAVAQVVRPIDIVKEDKKNNIEWQPPRVQDLVNNRALYANEHGYGGQFLETHDLLSDRN